MSKLLASSTNQMAIVFVLGAGVTYVPFLWLLEALETMIARPWLWLPDNGTLATFLAIAAGFIASALVTRSSIRR